MFVSVAVIEYQFPNERHCVRRLRADVVYMISTTYGAASSPRCDLTLSNGETLTVLGSSSDIEKLIESVTHNGAKNNANL